MAPVTEDYYQVLKVSRGATTADIARSYKRLGLQIHPARNNEADATAKFQLVSALQWYPGLQW
jgi:curved DNA-binding protein CbpA